jgi:hypothetical protein
MRRLRHLVGTNRCYVMRAALNRRLIRLDQGLLWAATLAGPRRVNINDIRQIDARLLVGKGYDLSVMILTDGDGRRLWLTQRMFDPDLDSLQGQIDAHTAAVTPRARHILGIGPEVPRPQRVLLAGISCAWYIGSMVALLEALILVQRHVTL